MNKQLLAISGLMVLLSGCSQLNMVKESIPFFSSEENQGVPLNAEEKVESKDNSINESTNDQAAENIQQNELVLASEFFNQVKEVNGKNIIQNPTNVLALVNKQYNLPSSYSPLDLVRPDVSFSFGDEKLEKSYLRQEASDALEKMFNKAAQQDIHLVAVSGYRSYDRQAVLFDAEVNKVGKKKAVQVVAIPGSSEHQSGLAIDISSHSANLILTEEFGKTVEGKWLAKHAHKYGYILRYPKGKETITGYQYEPWHFRYVGVEAAKVIYKNKWTLEEYLNIVEKI
ncbi:M15 family metallopeptidase [Bacillus sp. 31A1R]|uniref:M15 family metallopeptidase n=1 Tax=Robertmurraya mangrovi TaxID=3098077 RepID=A0ABU5J5F6_9BACI|nr:M15 family metallopeptidase [Bacillus sp. 31A1R]MDZ5474649.1 M15 family metallopeptidase [Bacillus sp. 31A1R]